MDLYGEYTNINNMVALTILIWGPGLHSSTRVANKRRDIKQTLLDQGHNALFSEELVTLEEPLALKSLERAQAKAADLIVILLSADAMGALAEEQDFANDLDLASKVYVLAPRSFKNSYVGHGTLFLLEKGYGGVYWYDDPEIESCNVLTETLIRVQARREIVANSRRLRQGDQL